MKPEKTPALGIIAATLIAAAALFDHSAHAGPGLLGSPVSILTASGKPRPACGMDSQGLSVTAWLHTDANNPPTIRFLRHTADGTPTGPATEISSPAFNTGPSLAVAPDGRFAIGYNTSLTSAAIHYFAPDGTEQWNQIVPLGSSAPVFPFDSLSDLCITRAGEVITTQTFDGSVHAQHFAAADGTPGPLITAFPANLFVEYPVITCTPDGHYAIATTETGTNYRAHTFDPQGNPLEQLSIPTTPTDFFEIDIAALPDRSFALAGFSTQSKELHLLRIPTTSPAAPNWVHTQLHLENATGLSLTSSKQGDLFLTWTEPLPGTTNNTAYGQRFFPCGKRADERFILRPNILATSDPSAAMNHSGQAIVAYSQTAFALSIPPNPPPPPSENIIHQRFCPLPNPADQILLPAPQTTLGTNLYVRFDLAGLPTTAEKALASIEFENGNTTGYLRFGGSTHIFDSLITGGPPPKVTMPTQDIAVVIWAKNNTLQSRAYILNATGSEPLGPLQTLFTGNQSIHYDIASRGDGSFLIAVGLSNSTELRLTRREPDYSPIHQATILLTQGNFDSIAIDMNTHGEFILLHADFQTQDRVYQRRYDENGQLLTNGSIPIDFPDGHQAANGIDIAINDHGEALALFKRLDPVPPNRFLVTTRGQFINPDGSPRGQNFYHHTETQTGFGFAQNPLLTTLGNGTIVLYEPIEDTLTAYPPRCTVPTTIPIPAHGDPNAVINGFALLPGPGNTFHFAWISKISATTRELRTRQYRLAPYTPTIRPIGNDLLQIAIPTIPGIGFTLESSSDLTSWSTLTTPSQPINNLIQFTVPTPLDREFFRFRLN